MPDMYSVSAWIVIIHFYIKSNDDLKHDGLLGSNWANTLQESITMKKLFE